jgi:hypothetical protein
MHVQDFGNRKWYPKFEVCSRGRNLTQKCSIPGYTLVLHLFWGSISPVTSYPKILLQKDGLTPKSWALIMPIVGVTDGSRGCETGL